MKGNSHFLYMGNKKKHYFVKPCVLLWFCVVCWGFFWLFFSRGRKEFFFLNNPKIFIE